MTAAILAAVVIWAPINRARATATWSLFETGISLDNRRGLIPTYLIPSSAEIPAAPSIIAAIEVEISAAASTGADGDALFEVPAFLAVPDLSDGSTAVGDMSAHQADLTTSEIADKLPELSAKWGAPLFTSDLPLTAYASAPPASSLRAVSNSQWSAATALTMPMMLAFAAVGLAGLVFWRR
jgi:hypothetical protein